MQTRDTLDHIELLFDFDESLNLTTNFDFFPVLSDPNLTLNGDLRQTLDDIHKDCEERESLLTGK